MPQIACQMIYGITIKSISILNFAALIGSKNRTPYRRSIIE